MLAAPLGARTVLYDLVTEVVHVLNPSAGLVWAACDGASDLTALVAEIVAATGAEAGVVQRDVEAGVHQLAEAGLVARTVAVPAPPQVERTAIDGRASSAVHAVLDDGVRFRGDDRDLLATIDALLGLDDQRAATIDLGVQQADDGTLRLAGWGPERTYGTREQFLDALPSALNQIAAASSTCIALHAGAVRSPSGEVVLLPALSGSGKTTLTAALVQAGWAYATDEAVGVRAGSLMAVAYPKPLVLDLDSQGLLDVPPTGSLNIHPTTLRADATVLRGEVGRVSRVVLPRYERDAEVSLVRLEPPEGIVAILEHALNLARVGPPGLDTLCRLAMEVPVHRLVHGGVAAAVPAIDGLV